MPLVGIEDKSGELGRLNRWLANIRLSMELSYLTAAGKLALVLDGLAREQRAFHQPFKEE